MPAHEGGGHVETEKGRVKGQRRSSERTIFCALAGHGRGLELYFSDCTGKLMAGGKQKSRINMNASR